MSDGPLFESLEGLRGTGKSTIAPMLAAARHAVLVPTVPLFYQPLRREVDRRGNTEARMCFYLSALFTVTDEIQRLLADGTPVVVESYFARCLANHQALGSSLGVRLPPRLPQPVTYQLTCGKDERGRRLAERIKPASRWDVLAEEVADRVTDAYAQFPMHHVDTTHLAPDEVLQTILSIDTQGAPTVQTQSLWEHTLTFFPQFLAALKERAAPDATVMVVGASDGKFVLPLAAAGYQVVAVEHDPLALHGGEVILPGDNRAHAMGLVDRLKLESLHDRVQIVEEDFLQWEPSATPCDAIWTSCAWHYSANHHRPLADFVTRMQSSVGQSGLYGAEFMMPITQRQHLIEHYTSPEKLRCHFIGDWDVLLTLRTNEFAERAHIGQLQDHTHRMGLLLAARTPS